MTDSRKHIVGPTERREEIALTFAQLRAANRARLPLFKNRRGEPAHSEPDGSDWLLSAWSNAVCGELGEAANLIKKIERGDMTLDEARAELGKELADVVTYLDILAFRAGVDLGAATIAKFNEVSERVGCDVTLPAKADAILASDGGREMVRELVEALEILLAWYHPEDTGTAPLRAVAIHAKAKEWLEGNKS